MRILTFILNLPWTILGLLEVIIAVPKKITFNKKRLTFIAEVGSLWWWTLLSGHKKVRAMAHGNMILLGPNIMDKDKEHELIHVDQFHQYPFVFPLLYLIENLRVGYKNNRFEKAAYKGAGNLLLEE